MISIETQGRSFGELSRLEWLETNGTGGWASGTLSGANTRRYHGLLVTGALSETRNVLVSSIQETIRSGSDIFELGANRFPGAVAPDGFKYLVSFTKDLLPVFEFHMGDIKLRKTIVATNNGSSSGEETTLVHYELLQGPREIEIDLRPFIAARNMHELVKQKSDIGVEWNSKQGRLLLHTNVSDIYISLAKSEFYEGGDWYQNFEYEREQERGLDFSEDLFTPGFLRIKLTRYDSTTVVISREPRDKLDPVSMLAKEKARRNIVVSNAMRAQRHGGVRPGTSTWEESKALLLRHLSLSLDQFIVTKPDGNLSLAAGYHWFTDWGRDAMISIPAIAHLHGREIASKILLTFAKSIIVGLVPNHSNPNGRANFNSADASLLFVIAAYQYLQITGDDTFVKRKLLPAIRGIMARFENGTLSAIHAEGGLLFSGEGNTWMDARLQGRPVTPRTGYAVEICALWFNALRCHSYFLSRFGYKKRSDRFTQLAERSQTAFMSSFWNDDSGCLVDCIGPDGRDKSIRPNQLFALSLPFQLFSGEKAKSILSAVRNKLVTDRGLRTLSKDDANFQGAYRGTMAQRDLAYHNGTVWPWLLGPYITAVVSVEGDSGREEGRRLLTALLPHLKEAAIGSISEIFDPGTLAPDGCISQAWSVAELFRVLISEI